MIKKEQKTIDTCMQQLSNLSNNIKSLGVNYNVIDYNWAHHLKSTEFWNTINIPNWSFWPEDTYEPQFGTIEHRKNSVTTSQEFLESIGKEKKDFLLLNRHWKLHRLLLLSQLHKLGIEKSLVSWDKQFSFQLNRDSFLMHDNNEEFLKLITETSSLLDIQDLTKIAGFGFENKEIYLNT